MFEVTLAPADYGIALKRAFDVIQAAHRIVVAAVENGGVTFAEVEFYLGAMNLLQNCCDCEDVQTSVFLDQAVDNWDYEETEDASDAA